MQHKRSVGMEAKNCDRKITFFNKSEGKKDAGPNSGNGSRNEEIWEDLTYVVYLKDI